MWIHFLKHRMVELANDKFGADSEENGRDPMVALPRSLLGGTEKNMKRINHDSWSLCRDSNQVPPKNLILEPCRYANNAIYKTYVITSGEGIAQSLRWRAGRPGLYPTHGQEVSLYSKVPRPPLRPTHLPVQWVRELSVKNGGAIPPPPFVFMAYCLIN
jgi:hypothetical protein